MEELKINAYFHHDLIEKIREHQKKGFTVVRKGCINPDGTRCWAILRKDEKRETVS